MAGAGRYEDLVVWQLADELQREIFALTSTGAAAADFKFRNQIRDSSSSAGRNIAEGFERCSDAELANYLRISRGSLKETHNSVRVGLQRGYFTADQSERLQRLATRGAKAAARLIEYLESPQAELNRKGRPPHRSRNK
jgi:four helix bundle protein